MISAHRGGMTETAMQDSRAEAIKHVSTFNRIFGKSRERYMYDE